jgi:hypothetical protein
MTITFESTNDVIIYALEKVIGYARTTQQIFVAQYVWWLASVIGLELELVIYIDMLQEREGVSLEAQSTREDQRIPNQDQYPQQVHPDRVSQISRGKSVSATPRDLTEDQRLDRMIESAERVIQHSYRDRTIGQRSQVNPLPTTKTQLKKAWKIKRLQEGERKREADGRQRLQEIRATVIRNLTKE